MAKTFINLFLLFSAIPLIKAYQIGIGIADCTGPVAQIRFMGYADIGQAGEGLHLRQFARAFIIDDGKNRVVFLSADAHSVGIGLKNEVLDRLNDNGYTEYNNKNVIMTATHTHSSPGGFLQDIIFDLSIGGFVPETYDALATGFFNAIVKAHNNMIEGKIFINSGDLLDANINRSPTSYLKNPEAERNEYAYDLDKTMTQLKFVSSADDSIIGVVNWFAVHPVSMNHSNHLVSSDNMGYASILLEKHLNDGALPAKGKIVGAFSSSSLGDSSPNTKGPICIDTGLPCDLDTSTCDGKPTNCIAFGPGDDMFESTRIIGEKLFNKAKDLLESDNATELTGDIIFAHQWIDMPNTKIQHIHDNGTIETLSGCKPALGYSFGAGTTDGPGASFFSQGTNETTKFWERVRNALAPPTKEDEECHYPKPILLATGRMIEPYQWQPEIVATQVFGIGQFFIVAIPGELTTMSGRRMRKAVKETALKNGYPDETVVVISGLSNTYTDYVTTPEEYRFQRYEGASTIFGPNTLPIYLSQYKNLTEAAIQRKTLEDGPDPVKFEDKLFSIVPPVVLDLPGYLHKFGSCVQQPQRNAKLGDVIEVKFVAGHPRNNWMQGDTFLTVEKKDGDDWNVLYTDASWETRFIWNRNRLATSESTVIWDSSNEITGGTYRIRHFGYAKNLLGELTPYEGSTREFSLK